MRSDLKVTLLCAVAAVPFGIAVTALNVPKSQLAWYLWGGLALTILIFGIAVVIASREKVKTMPEKSPAGFDVSHCTKVDIEDYTSVGYETALRANNVEGLTAKNLKFYRNEKEEQEKEK